MEKLSLTQEWDKVFPKSDKVDHKKVTFHNRYGITLAADMYTPKSVVGTRECHIEPDWLLIYEIRGEVLLLMLYRLGSHSELFKK